MTSMKRWMGVVTAAAFVATMAPSLAYARGADDLRPHLPKPQKPERPQKPHFAAKGVAAPKPAVNPKQQFGKGGIRVAAKTAPAPKPVNPKQQFGKGGKLPA
jgi:hypothetical protein